MNKPTAIIVGLAFVALIGGLVAVNAIDPGSDDRERPLTAPQTVTVSEENTYGALYEDSGMGLSFSYDDKRYFFEILPSTSDEHVKTIVLTDIDAYRDLIGSDVPREGPPTLMIQVYRNPDREWPRTWADAYPHISGIEQRVSEVTDTTVGGANAIRYMSDGLYPTDTIVTAHGSFIYMLSGSYLDESSPTKRDFEPLVQSVTFIPEAEQ